MPTNGIVVTEPSICIPRTLNNMSWYFVKQTIEKITGPGTVERVDIVPARDNSPFCKIFIHMRYWPNSGAGYEFRERLVEGENVTIVYDSPWFWKCSASRIPKPEKRRPQNEPYIDFSRSSTNNREHPKLEVKVEEEVSEKGEEQLVE